VFNAEGTGSSLATVVTLATLTLLLPRFTTTQPGPAFSPGQLAFAAVASLLASEAGAGITGALISVDGGTAQW